MTLFQTLARNALRPNYLPVLAQKAWTRLWSADARQAPAARAWARERAESYEAFATERDPGLWQEASAWADQASADARAKIAQMNVVLGGGGAYPLLYFLVRLRRPQTVIETGVAAGYSSLSLLSALARNGSGRLYSSDFPYFRLDNPEQYVGCLVPEDLKHSWTLLLKGDRSNLPEILRASGPVDFFHYDSDKSTLGRAFAMGAVEPHLKEDALVLMDDIQDNWFFRDYVERAKRPFRIFEFDGKYVGAVGL